MGGKTLKNGFTRAVRNKRTSKFAFDSDPFFTEESKRRRKLQHEDSDINSSDSDDEIGVSGSAESDREDVDVAETVQEKKHRLSKAFLESLHQIARKDVEEEEEEEDREFDKEGERDSFISKQLMKQHLEDTGRLRRSISLRLQRIEEHERFNYVVKHRNSVTTACLSNDDASGFSSSKDGTIMKWDVESSKGEKYRWPDETVLKNHGMKDPLGRAVKHSKHVLSLAVSSDGRYLASGGHDRHVHLWDTRTREHLQAFPGHRAPVSCLAFREGTTELFSGSFDRSIKIWNAEDRTYVNTLFGHQSEVLAIDCLRKERVLAVGRDRTMQLFKVPEESRLIFRSSTSSLECCCFIDNAEFLSGSDDGNIELWNIQKKKPVFTAKNSNSLSANSFENKDEPPVVNGRPGTNTFSLAKSWVSSVAVCHGSDLAASGAGDGLVRLWALESDKGSIRPLHGLSLDGFVNSLAFAKSGKFLIAGVGKELRLGRWGRVPSAQNGVAIHRLKYSE